ncbi:MAG: DUF2079 domain-containing protein [Coleofasciculus sp. S288]|nr:DUF2079 domain-containing protein [Coleofasciculus sp. S288]
MPLPKPIRQLKINSLTWMIGGSSLLLFVCSSIRHALFESSAWDLGIFDQAVYLISQGKPPISSFIEFHILGDHAAWVFYPLALLYKIYPDVHWLFAVQAIALSLGALPTWYLARQAGLKEAQATTMAVVYLLYPLIFNVNLFDFHPEVMALPALLGAILAARLGRVLWFSVAIFFILGCKAVLALTVAAMGVWLLVFEKTGESTKRNAIALIAIVAGVAWFLIATQLIIPSFSGTEALALNRYAYLGNSVLEIGKNLLLKPGLVLGNVFSLDTLEYLGLLVLPVIWGLSPQHLTPLVGAIPTLLLNILSESPAQRNLVHQYSLPILPFLVVAAIATLASGRGWLQNRRWVILWSFVAFLALAKYGYFGSIYLDSLDTWQATRDAIAYIQPHGSVLTPPQVAPHLTHRPIVKVAITGSESAKLSEFEYVLLNLRHPGFGSTPQVAATLLERLKTMPEFQLTYQSDDVYLFEKRS